MRKVMSLFVGLTLFAFVFTLVFTPVQIFSAEDADAPLSPLSPLPPLPPLLCLEHDLHPAIVETRKICVPGFPHAFNPSLVPWGQGWLMSFREKCQVDNQWVSLIGIILLSRDFRPIGFPHILHTDSIYSADPRLIWVENELYIVFNDRKEEDAHATRSCSHMHMAKLHKGPLGFQLVEKRLLREFREFTGFKKGRTEKNWVPFAYRDLLLFAYSLRPHVILFPAYEHSEHTACFAISKTLSHATWKWGPLRGGTPALLINGHYLAFFHSPLRCRSVESGGEERIHYFIGAYTFAAREPFRLEKISPFPVIGKGFYAGTCYTPYGPSVQVVFPCGLAQDGDYLWLAYGRQDHEVWVAKIHTQTLLDTLMPLGIASEGCYPEKCNPEEEDSPYDDQGPISD